MTLPAPASLAVPAGFWPTMQYQGGEIIVWCGWTYNLGTASGQTKALVTSFEIVDSAGVSRQIPRQYWPTGTHDGYYAMSWRYNRLLLQDAAGPLPVGVYTVKHNGVAIGTVEVVAPAPAGTVIDFPPSGSDDTTAFFNVATKPGATVRLVPGGVYNLTKGSWLGNGVRIIGNGATINFANNSFSQGEWYGGKGWATFEDCNFVGTGWFRPAFVRFIRCNWRGVCPEIGNSFLDTPTSEAGLTLTGGSYVTRYRNSGFDTPPGHPLSIYGTGNIAYDVTLTDSEHPVVIRSAVRNLIRDVRIRNCDRAGNASEQILFESEGNASNLNLFEGIRSSGCHGPLVAIYKTTATQNVFLDFMADGVPQGFISIGTDLPVDANWCEWWQLTDSSQIASLALAARNNWLCSCALVGFQPRRLMQGTMSAATYDPASYTLLQAADPSNKLQNVWVTQANGAKVQSGFTGNATVK